MREIDKIIRLIRALKTIMAKVEEQAEDENLWFIAEHADTQIVKDSLIVQDGLRDLHDVIEKAVAVMYKEGDE